MARYPYDETTPTAARAFAWANGSSTPSALGTDVDWSNDARNYTKTVSGTVTFTESNASGYAGTPYGEVALVLTNSGTVAEPTWPGTWTDVGSTSWDTTSGVAHLVLVRRFSDSVAYFTLTVLP